MGSAVCCGQHASDTDVDKRVESFDSQLRKRKIDTSKALASVNGIPIYKSDVAHYVQLGLVADNAEDALEEVIDIYLLADEARNRGYASNSAVITTFKKSLALQILKRVGRRFTVDDISEDVLKAEYEKRKKQLVHGESRKTSHGLVRVRAGTEPTEKQKQLARRIYNQTKNIKTEQAFKDAVKKIQREAPQGAVFYEALPEFDEKDTTFVKPFVDAALAVDFPKEHVSHVVKTKFGLHVIFVASASEPKNMSFKEAKEMLAQDIFASERDRHVKTYIDKLVTEGNVFVYDKVLATVHAGGVGQ